MTVALSRRLARAVDVGAATPEERDLIVEASQRVRSFEGLPEPIRELVIRLETPPS